MPVNSKTRLQHEMLRGREKICTLYGGYVVWVAQVTFDPYLHVVQNGELDRREDVVLRPLGEQDGRIRRVVARGQRCSKRRSIVLTVCVWDYECLPCGDVSRQQQEGNGEANPRHGFSRSSGHWRLREDFETRQALLYAASCQGRACTRC